jgi:hypothetical protein
VRLILAALLMFPLLAGAVARDLDDCDTIATPPTALAPLDLDTCEIDDGDDITGILTGLASTYGDVYVRAPSRTANVYAAYTVFTVDDFYFYEDEDGRNTLLIQHVSVNPSTCAGADCWGFWILWSFENFDNVVIGGPNLSLTLQGNHPGLANCTTHYDAYIEIGKLASDAAICNLNAGFVQFNMTDGSAAVLADVRANFKFTQAYALYTNGSTTVGGTTNKINQFNAAGMYFATSGIFFHQGTKNAWADPDRTVFSDPFARHWGWEGTQTATLQGGLPVGCTSLANSQARQNVFNGFYVDSITGGVTIEYAGFAWTPRYSGAIGSAGDPFIIRVKDWHVSGPGTPYPAGVRPKKRGETILMKGDPHDAGDDVPRRFVRFIKLPDDYGSGPASVGISGCTESGNAGPDADSRHLRWENSVASGRTNRGWDIELAGDWRSYAQGGTILRGTLFSTAFDTYRSYNNTLRIASGTTYPETFTMHDTVTAIGPGTWAGIAVADFNANNPGRNNTVTDTQVSGVIAIDADTENTTVSNVNFTGSARAVITIGANSDATVTDLCVPDGSTITGTGTLTYEGVEQSPDWSPFNIPNGTAECSITADGRPDPPSGGSVN